MPNPEAANLIVKSCYDKKLSATDPSDIVTLIGVWRAMVGATKDADPVQVQTEANFLKIYFGNFSKQDVENAIHFFLGNKLDIDIPEYVTFSTMHISRVMNSYIRYKTKAVMQLDEIAGDDLERLKEGGMQQRIEGMKDCIRDCIQHSKEDFKERFFNVLVYDFLRKSGRLKIDTRMKENAKKYAEQKYVADKIIVDKEREKMTGIAEKSIGQVLDMTPAKIHQRKDAIRLYGIDYCLKMFFEQTDMDILINNITEKDFK